MKKVFFISIFLVLFLLTGCSKYNEKTIVKDLNKKINAITGYHIEGTMEIYSNDEVYKYNVDSSYENDNYRVSLINKLNNHEQIILKNADGVYVLTPSLNKSFKFQSNWPNNNSQVYLLQSLLTDINKDDKLKMEEKDGNYILSTKISYSNNKNLVNQKIYLDKNLNFKKVIVFDESGNKQIKMLFNLVDTKASFNGKYFSTSENMKTVDIEKEDEEQNNINKENKNNKTTKDNSNEKLNDSEEEIDNNSTNNSNIKEDDSKNLQSDKEDNSSSTSKLDDTVYPMYLPSGTYLSTEETVSKDNGERIILTFAGESPFILVEETVKKMDETEIIPVYGEPTLLMDSVAALSDTSVNFISNGVEYYIASESLTKQEILQVAESISSIPIMK